MKIGIVVPRLEGGGAEFVAREWAKWLAASGDDVVVFVTDVRAAEAPAGVELVHVGGGVGARLLKLRREFHRRELDAVLALMPYWNLLTVTATLGMGASRPRVVISGRNMAIPLAAAHSVAYRVKQRVATLLYRRADAFVAISHPVAAEAIAAYGLAPGTVHVVPNPAIAKVGTDRDRSRVGPIGEVHAIVVPARLVPQKRPLLAIEIASAIGRKRGGQAPTVHYFGVGPMRDAVERHAADLGVEAVMHGWAAAWYDEVPQRAVVVLTSLSEGFGNVLVEAAAVGVPSVASSKCLGSADAILPGATGALAMGDSVDDYVAAVEEATATPMAVARGWLNHFSPESSGRKIRSVLAPGGGVARE